MNTIRIPITEFLTNEHAMFNSLFDEIDRLLPYVLTVTEVRLLSRLVQGVLSHHADVEQNLAYAALDHVLAEKDPLKRLYQDHEEINADLRDAAFATEFTKARALLKAGLKASREHFHREEQTVFPLFEKMFDSETLAVLSAGYAGNDSSLGQHGFANALSARLRKPASPNVTLNRMTTSTLPHAEIANPKS